MGRVARLTLLGTRCRTILAQAELGVISDSEHPQGQGGLESSRVDCAPQISPQEEGRLIPQPRSSLS